MGRMGVERGERKWTETIGGHRPPLQQHPGRRGLRRG